MSNRLFVDLKENHKGEVVGSIKLPADGLFTFEALLAVVETFAESVDRPVPEVLADLYNFARGKNNKNAPHSNPGADSSEPAA